MNRERDIPQKIAAADLHLLRQVIQHLSGDMLRQLLPGVAAEEAKSALRRVLATLGAEPPATAPAAPPTPAARSHHSAAAGNMAGCSLFTDGASRGNPGLAGAGYVLTDDQGREILSGTQFLGVCTNNVAEYRALLLGLTAAAGHGCRDLSVLMDSELIVKQLKGEYRVKDEKLKPLFDEVRKSCSRFSRCRFSHVPRSRNSRADQLANLAIDERNKQR